MEELEPPRTSYVSTLLEAMSVRWLDEGADAAGWAAEAKRFFFRPNGAGFSLGFAKRMATP